MPRPARPDGLRPGGDDGTINVNFRIPAALHRQIKLLALDPVTGRVPPYGWSRIVEDALALWLARQQVAIPGEDAPDDPGNLWMRAEGRGR